MSDLEVYLHLSFCFLASSSSWWQQGGGIFAFEICILSSRKKDRIKKKKVLSFKLRES